jgi:hypothetical protein
MVMQTSCEGGGCPAAPVRVSQHHEQPTVAGVGPRGRAKGLPPSDPRATVPVAPGVLRPARPTTWPLGGGTRAGHPSAATPGTPAAPTRLPLPPPTASAERAILRGRQVRASTIRCHRIALSDRPSRDRVRPTLRTWSRRRGGGGVWITPAGPGGRRPSCPARAWGRPWSLRTRAPSGANRRPAKGTARLLPLHTGALWAILAQTRRRRPRSGRRQLWSSGLAPPLRGPRKPELARENRLPLPARLRRSDAFGVAPRSSH